MSSELKTLKDIESFGEYTELVGREKLKAEAMKRIKFINEIFLEEIEMDKSPPRTQREAYFHQLGKFEELKRFCDITKEDLNEDKG